MRTEYRTIYITGDGIEFDKLVAIVAGVARNSINHTPQVIAAAKDFDARFCRLLNEDN